MVDVPKAALLALLVVLAATAAWTALDHRTRAACALRALWAAGSTRRWLCVLLAVAVFAVVAEDTLLDERDEIVHRLDEDARGFLHVSDALRPVAAIVSHATGPWLVPVVAVVIIALAIAGRSHDALVVGLGTLSAWVLSGLLKVVFGVPRPRAHPPWKAFASFGFPSGHTLVTLVACGLLAWAFTRRARGRIRAGAIALAALVALGSGASRMVLDRHWASDVIAGFAVGVAWLSLVVTIAEHGAAARQVAAPSEPGSAARARS